MSRDDDIARLLFWPLLIAVVGLLLMLTPPTAAINRGPGHPTDTDGLHLGGLACLIGACIQMIITTAKWWRRRYPRE